MANIPNFPNIRPSLLLDFANSGMVDPRIQCTRASTATCFGPDGKLRTVAANVPRIDYDPATGKCLGLLVEDARTNILTYSNNISHSAWLKSGGSTLQGEDLSPDGESLAQKFVENTQDALHAVRRDGALTATQGRTYTFSGYVKAAGRTQLRISISGTIFSSSSGVLFDVEDGTTSNASGTVVYIGNGWWRCVFTSTADASGTANFTPQLALNTGGVGGYQGDGTSGVYLWGWQIEEGSSPTSYIPTEASAVTRARDVVTMSTAGWYNSDGRGTVLSEFTNQGVTNGGPWSLSEGFTNLRGIGVTRTSDTGTRLRALYRAGDTAHYSSLPLNSHVVGTPIKLAATFNSAEGIRLCQGGGDVTDAGGSSGVPVVNTLRLGDSRVAGAGPFDWSGVISRLVYYPDALPPVQLQRLTT